MYGDWTVREYAARWIAARVAHGLVCAGDDGARLRIHAMPIIGHLKMHEVEQRHIRDLMRMLRADGKLAPRSVRHLYAVLHTMFRDALIDGAIRSNPCVLRRGDLPKQVDKDPTWRVGAVFTRDELERLISDRRVPEDRRTFYALLGLTGLRFGEAAALRWRSYDATLEPLGRLLVASSWSTRGRLERATKTEQPRLVPVHPVLAKILARWKSDGWRSIMGRLPEPDDLLIPSRRGVHRSRYRTLKTFYKDADRLGMRRRRQHDLRRTFISLARAGGARKDVLECITHGTRGDIVDLYTELPWFVLCEEVAKLQVASPLHAKYEHWLWNAFEWLAAKIAALRSFGFGHSAGKSDS